MADFEDANSPTWENVADGQQNVYDAVRGTIELETAEKSYRLNDEIATLVSSQPRLASPRAPPSGRRRAGERVAVRLRVDGVRNAREQLERGSGPYFYLPKLESHEEARLWAQAFAIAEDGAGAAAGSIKCTVLIETILAAFEMDAILYELREHSCALNAGRWDYIFSCIKKQGARAARSCAGDDDGAVHARVYGAARPAPATRVGRTRSAGWPRSSRRAATRR